MKHIAGMEMHAPYTDTQHTIGIRKYVLGRTDLHSCTHSNITTWSASAKLAVIFPGFSFVTGLVLCNHQRFFLSRVLLLGFGKLLSIKMKCHCRFVVMCVGFTTNCQNKSQSKSLPPDIHPLLFYTPRPTQ